MKYFKATLKFDYGTFCIITTASDKDAAIAKICKSENCPPCAITHICEHSGAGLIVRS
jgi:hypothetical protein